MIATMTVPGRWSSGSPASLAPASVIEPAHGVVQGGHVARLQVERRDVGERAVGVDDLVDVVELRQVGQALAGALALLVDERGEAALDVGLDRLHRPAPVEEEVEVGEVGTGHGGLLGRPFSWVGAA